MPFIDVTIAQGRSPDEVRFLMGFNRAVIRRRRDQLNAWGVRMRWIGRRPRLWRGVIKELEAAEQMTRDNDRLTLYFCVNYGGRSELVGATRALDGFPTFFPRRTSFYGAEEIGFIEPGGNYVTIAQFAANASDEA